MTGSPSRLSTIGGSWSVMFAPGPGWPRSRIRRAGAEAPRSHLASKMGPRQEQWRRWISRHHSPNRAAEVSVGRCPGWERIWERVLLRGALPCFTPLPHAPSWPARGDVNAGHGLRNTFLGVKGSPVQIRPSRPEGPGQKGYRVLTRAPFRSSGANRGAALTISPMCQRCSMTCAATFARSRASPDLRLGSPPGRAVRLTWRPEDLLDDGFGRPA
jgi:hypothetical protein